LHPLLVSVLAIITVGVIFAFFRSLILVSIHRMGTWSKRPSRRSRHE
jgi:hypothetical protein